MQAVVDIECRTGADVLEASFSATLMVDAGPPRLMRLKQCSTLAIACHGARPQDSYTLMNETGLEAHRRST